MKFSTNLNENRPINNLPQQLFLLMGKKYCTMEENDATYHSHELAAHRDADHRREPDLHARLHHQLGVSLHQQVVPQQVRAALRLPHRAAAGQHAARQLRQTQRLVQQVGIRLPDTHQLLSSTPIHAQQHHHRSPPLVLSVTELTVPLLNPHVFTALHYSLTEHENIHFTFAKAPLLAFNLF